MTKTIKETLIPIVDGSYLVRQAESDARMAKASSKNTVDSYKDTFFMMLALTLISVGIAHINPFVGIAMGTLFGFGLIGTGIPFIKALFTK